MTNACPSQVLEALAGDAIGPWGSIWRKAPQNVTQNVGVACSILGFAGLVLNEPEKGPEVLVLLSRGTVQIAQISFQNVTPLGSIALTVYAVRDAHPGWHSMRFGKAPVFCFSPIKQSDSFPLLPDQSLMFPREALIGLANPRILGFPQTLQKIPSTIVCRSGLAGGPYRTVFDRLWQVMKGFKLQVAHLPMIVSLIGWLEVGWYPLRVTRSARQGCLESFPPGVAVASSGRDHHSQRPMVTVDGCMRYVVWLKLEWRAFRHCKKINDCALLVLNASRPRRPGNPIIGI